MNRTRRDPSGQTLVIVALSLVVLLLFVALAVDVGFWYSQRRAMQNAADAGALAGAQVRCFDPMWTEGRVQDSAVRYATHNYHGQDKSAAAAGMVSVDLAVEVAIGGEPRYEPSATGNVVVVTARTAVMPFFAPIMRMARIGAGDGLTIGATAAASCGPATAGCGIWPVAFDRLSYRTSVGACNGPSVYDPDWVLDENNVNLGSQFIVWAGDNQDWDPDYVNEHCAFVSNQSYDLASVVGGSPMEPGNRGWVALSMPKKYKLPKDSGLECGDVANCGTPALTCWLKYGFIGSIAVGDCVAPQTGEVTPSFDAAKFKLKEPVSVLLYDGHCDEKHETVGECTGSYAYNVSDFGCVRVEHIFDGKQRSCWNESACKGCPSDDPALCKPSCPAECRDGRKFDTIEFIHRLAAGDSAYIDKYGCTQDAKGDWTCDNPAALSASCPAPSTGIIVTKLCSCPPSQCIGAGSGEPDEADLTAVSLVRVLPWR